MRILQQFARAVRALRRHRVIIYTVSIVAACAFTAVCIRCLSDHWSTTPVSAHLIPGDSKADGSSSKTLFVLIHGMGGARSKHWESFTAALDEDGGLKPGKLEGDKLIVSYPAFVLSNANAETVAAQISDQIETYFNNKTYNKVVLVGYSMGALITRKAFLHGCGDTACDNSIQKLNWVDKVDRIVLMSGMNRGWDLTTKKPMDMTWWKHLRLTMGNWIAETTGTGQFCRQAESGSPFVSNLRLEWLRWYRRGVKADTPELKPLTVQLLGDIDDLVSEADNKDLAGSQIEADSKDGARTQSKGLKPRFAFLRVRGTDHPGIIDFKNSEFYSGLLNLGQYRRHKFLIAATGSDADVISESEAQPVFVDNDVKHLVFVVHGIRDYGEWSVDFETSLNRDFKVGAKPGDKLAIASIRYGYFGMGPFLIRSDRQKFVRWLMNEYTETVARYPNLETDEQGRPKIDFIGHSNGTYLLANALQQYRSLKVRRVVFGGSVIRQDYKWTDVMPAQVSEMRNYVAADDLVVGLLPRVFECCLTSWLNPDLGSAGYNGFTDNHVTNIKYLTGGHGAFLYQIPAISDFVVNGPSDRPKVSDTCRYVEESKRGNSFCRFVSDYGCQVLWAGVLLLVVVVGFGLRQAGLTWLMAYLLVVFLILTGF